MHFDAEPKPKVNPLPADDPEAEPVDIRPPSKRDDNRLFIKTRMIRKLVAHGIPDDTHSLSLATNQILDYAIEATLARPTTLSDLLAVEEDLTIRVEELTACNLGLAKLLADLAATLDYQQRYNRIREMVQVRLEEASKGEPK